MSTKRTHFDNYTAGSENESDNQNALGLLHVKTEDFTRDFTQNKSILSLEIHE